MPRGRRPTKPLPNKRTPGRKKIPINWDEVDKALLAGCTGVEIAASLGIHEDTLYLACKDEKEKHWTDYAAEGYGKGRNLLRQAQYETAIKDKQASLLIWLGKQESFLGQREPKDKEEAPSPAMLIEALNSLKKLAKAAGVIDEEESSSK